MYILFGFVLNIDTTNIWLALCADKTVFNLKQQQSLCHNVAAGEMRVCTKS